MYQASQSILDFCKENYSINSKLSDHWKLTENLILIDKNILNGKWTQARNHVERLAVISIQQALLSEMNIFILEGNFDKAKEVGNRVLLSLNKNSLDLLQLNSFDNQTNSTFYNYNSNHFNTNNINDQFEFLSEQISLK